MPRTRPLLAVTALAAASLAPLSARAATAGPAQVTQITPKNVVKLGGAWLDHLEGGAAERAQEGTPVAYTNSLVALNARTGDDAGHRQRQVPGQPDTVVLGRTWDPTAGAPSPAENLASQTAMAPEIMTVPVGATVTFSNPAGNSKRHCAEAFFDPEFFKVGPLAPGQSGTFRFTRKGTYFYNDCAGFPWNTGEIIVS